MRRTLGILTLTAALAGCGSDTSSTEEPTPTPTATARGALADLTVASLDEQPCADAGETSLDEAIASGGVWMPTAKPALMDDLGQAWTCAPDTPALQWPELTIVFLPEAPPGDPDEFFQDAADRLGRGSLEEVLGSPALVLEPEGDEPAEVETVMGDTHIVLVGSGATTGDELLAVAGSMAPLH